MLTDTIRRSALHRWKRIWKLAPESILDPRNPRASLAFQATSYLTLAYMRLSQLDHWFTQLTTAGSDIMEAYRPLLGTNIDQPRSAWSAWSLIHSAHALMIVVRLGLDYTRQILAYYWDPQHFLCWTESVIHLSEWLAATAKSGADFPLSREHLLSQTS